MLRRGGAETGPRGGQGTGGAAIAAHKGVLYPGASPCGRPRNRREVFGCFTGLESKLALRFRLRISPLRRGFLLSGPQGLQGGSFIWRTGWVCLLVLMVVLSLSRMGGNSGQTRWLRAASYPAWQRHCG